MKKAKQAEAYRSLDEREAAKPAAVLQVGNGSRELELEALDVPVKATELPEAEGQPAGLPTRRWQRPQIRPCCSSKCCRCCLAASVLVVALLSMPHFNAALLSWMTSWIYGPFYGDASGFQHGPTASPRAVLRNQWRNGTVTSPLARKFEATQNPPDCGVARFSNVQFHAAQGLGANLHFWADILCEVSARDHVLVTQGPWVWRDSTFCGSNLDFGGFSWVRRMFNLFDFYPGPASALECYFGSETSCPLPAVSDEEYLYAGGRNIYQTFFWDPKPGKTATYMRRGDMWTVQGGTDAAPLCNDSKATHQAAVELLFNSLPARLIEAAERANAQVFGPSGAPADMVAVHIRWGDKGKENSLVSIDRYVDAVKKHVERHQLGATPTVFITTADPAALKAFKEAAPSSWLVRYFSPALGTGDVEEQLTDAVSTTAKGATDSGGALGLNSLITLLLSLEGRFFVLTASSNWSILINELRRSRVNVGCHGCTDMISLTPTKCMNGFEYLCVSLDL